jgi:hypothetical protein
MHPDPGRRGPRDRHSDTGEDFLIGVTEPRASRLDQHRHVDGMRTHSRDDRLGELNRPEGVSPAVGIEQRLPAPQQHVAAPARVVRTWASESSWPTLPGNTT